MMAMTAIEKQEPIFTTHEIDSDDKQLAPSERLLHPDVEELSLLPDLPYRIKIQDGSVIVAERKATTFASKSDLRYQPTAPSSERLEELQALALYTGAEDINDFVEKQVDIDAIKASAPSYLTRRLSEQSTALDTLREMRRSALEQLYVARVIELGRKLLQDVLPTMVPHSPTVGLVNERMRQHVDADATYDGQFRGVGLVSLRGSNISRDKIDALTTESVQALAGAHELLHQRHAEVQGVSWWANDYPDIFPPTIATTTDPWELYQDMLAYEATLSLANGRPLYDQLCSNLSETIAYLGQAEISGTLDNTLAEDVGHGVEAKRAEITWTAAFAALAPLGQRAEIIDRLMHIDLAQFADLSDADFTNLINNPVTILEYALIG